ncbi:S41 family peptidase [Streptomyces radiopugnans]|uniref:Carboxyl-terminal processing protease n=1 Tax=Streptomyces radiopugnans TaxID=403935 RepID=A0A1H8YTU1_9ACTN|nr:S41 family peptidase [Streptomyces radiopugnans]SEP55625.1 carboxyl-terminal processing protease [Streptomyces radiopugnans]
MSGTSKFVPHGSARAEARVLEGGRRPRRILRGTGLTLVFAVVLAAGAVTESWGDVTEGDAAPVSPRPAGAGVRESAPPHQDAVHDAEELVSRSGDRWAAAYTAREYAGLRQSLDGRYVGVGVSVRRTGADRVEIARVQPGSPAAKSGVRAGDRLVAVDGTGTEGRPVTDVVALLRGGAPGEGAPPGSRVVLGLARGSLQWEERLERARLSVETVTVTPLAAASPGAAGHSAAGVTRVRVDSFTRGTGEELRRAVEGLPPDGGILLDLRGNSGGLVAEAAEAASVFLDGGLVATYGDGDTERALYARPGGNTASPLVVLVDGGTMSAAELLAGALQDRGRAVVVGTRTFGKGSVQEPREQPDGSVAELTVGHYTTPGGRTFEEGGLLPDLEVRPGQDAQEEARTVLSGLATRS